MKKLFVSVLLALTTMIGNLPAQELTATAPNGTFAPSDIEYWIGEGENEIGIILVYKNDSYEKDNLVFGYRWDGGSKSLQNILSDIQLLDPNFQVTGEEEWGYYTLEDIAYDEDGDGTNDYTFSNSGCMWVNIYSNGATTYNYNFTGNKWISIECAKTYSDACAAKTATYNPIPSGEEITCPAPKGLTVTNITSSSATVTWEYDGEETDFRFYWKKTDDEDFDSADVFEKIKTLTSLDHNTSYTCYVSTVCSSELSKGSSKKSFRMACVLLTKEDLPYTEDFDSYGNDFPYCWTIISDNATNPQMSTQKKSGTKSLQVSTPTTAAYSVCQGLGDDIPMGNLKISFYSKCSGGAAEDTTFKVGLISSLDADDFEELAVIAPTTAWKQYEIRLDKKSFDNTKKYIAIKAENNGTSRKLFVDDFTLDTVSDCEHPIITAINVPLVNPNAEIVFEKGHQSDTLCWIYYQKSGNETYDSLQASDSPATLALEYSSTYNIWMRTQCSQTEQSDIFEIRTITTPCAAITVPFEEDFNSYAQNTFPMCWNKIGGSSIGAASYLPNGGTGMSISVGHSGFSADAFVVLPYLSDEIDIQNIRLTFYGKGYTKEEIIYAGVMSDANDVSTFDTVKEIVLEHNVWNKKEADLDSYNGSGRYVALLFKNPKSGYQTLYLDDISLDYIPSCDKPVNLYVKQNAQNPTSADVYFTKANDYDNEWKLYYKSETEEEFSSADIQENPYTLDGLDLKKDYTFYLTTVCGDKESEASEQVVYLTPCYGEAITEFPYLQDFEEDGLRCLTQELDSSWQSAGVSASPMTYSKAIQGENYAKLWAVGTMKNARLVLPLMNLTEIENPILSFYHIQKKYSGQDSLTVLYRTSADGEWNVLKEFNDNITDWTLQYIELPEPSAAYQIAFEGKTHYGMGVGIDSIAVSAYVCNNPVVNIVDSLCPGSTYTFYGEDYTEEGTFTITSAGYYNCDTTINLTLTYKQPYDSVLTVDLCQGDTYSINGVDYDAQGEYDLTIVAQQSCDTNIHLIINTIYPTDTTIDVTLNEGDQIVVGDEIFYQEGSFVKIIPNAVGCDSVITLNITVIPADIDEENVIEKDDDRIIAWAKGAELYRDTTEGNYYDAVGKMTNTEYASLGNAGYAVITFDRPIINGIGYDFAVFSHGSALNTAYVEVSSDGQHYFRFPASSIATDSSYTSGSYTNLAGVYTTGYGVAFDLDDVQGNNRLNKYNIRFVKIIDVQSGTDTAADGKVIYDDGGAFKLSGIGIINGGITYNIADMENLLSEANSYEIVSPAVSGVQQDANGEYYKNYESGGLYFRGQTMYNGNFAMGFGPSTVTDWETSTGNSPFKSYYASSALSGSDGAATGYLQAYYSDYGLTPEHNVVERSDSSTFYPYGVYVSNSVSSYKYDKTNSSVKKGYHKVIAIGFDANGQVTDSVAVYLEENGVPYKEWKWLELTSLGEVRKVKFILESNYMAYGFLDIPAYFCIDNFVYAEGSRQTDDSSYLVRTICEGDSYMGKTQTGTYVIGDTVLILTVNPLNEINVDTTVCSGSTFEFNGKEYTTPQTVIDTVQAEYGCDTVYTINLAFADGIITYDTVTVNPDELPYVFGDLSLQEDCDTVYTFESAGGCDSTVYLHFEISSSIEDLTNGAVVNIYPNPATDNIIVDVKGMNGRVEILISDIKGNKVALYENDSEKEFIKVPLYFLETGVYFVTVKNEAKQKTVKLIKK